MNFKELVAPFDAKAHQAACEEYDRYYECTECFRPKGKHFTTCSQHKSAGTLEPRYEALVSRVLSRRKERDS